MRVGMLARGVIVGKLHANFIADALAPEIPVEMIEGHGKLPPDKKMAATSGQGARAVDVTCQVCFGSCSTMPLFCHCGPEVAGREESSAPSPLS